MLFKRAQAAMEFLMTYGWAILVVLIVVGALAYFGVLNPQNLIPEKCVFPTMLTCQDYQVLEKGAANNDGITLVLLNGAGKDIILRNISITGDAVVPGTSITTGCNTTFSNAGAVSIPASTSVTLTVGAASGGTNVVPLSVCNLDSNKDRGKVKYTVAVDYQYTDSTYVHPIVGELFARAG